MQVRWHAIRDPIISDVFCFPLSERSEFFGLIQGLSETWGDLSGCIFFLICEITSFPDPQVTNHKICWVDGQSCGLLHFLLLLLSLLLFTQAGGEKIDPEEALIYEEDLDEGGGVEGEMEESTKLKIFRRLAFVASKLKEFIGNMITTAGKVVVTILLGSSGEFPIPGETQVKLIMKEMVKGNNYIP